MPLADKLATLDIPRTPPRRGPIAACDVYGVGSADDLTTVDNLRKVDGLTWAEVQYRVDLALGIAPERRIKPDMFRYHWRGKCAHWDGVL